MKYLDFKPNRVEITKEFPILNYPYSSLTYIAILYKCTEVLFTFKA